MRLIYYEGRKHFLTLAVLVLLVFFSVINGIKIYSVYQESSFFSEQNQPQFREPYEHFYEEYRGELTYDKVKSLLEIYNPIKEVADIQIASTEKNENSYTYNEYSDEIFFRWCFLDEMKYDYGYKAYANHIVSKAKENISFYQKTGYQYGERESYAIAKAFYKRELTNFYNTERYQYLFYYDFSSLLIIIICLYGCSSVFVKEQETEMKMIISTSRNGNANTFVAKWVAMIFFVAAICFLFSLEDYFFFSLFFRNGDAGGEPLYALQGFQNTLLNCSLNQSFLVFTATRLFGVCVLGSFFVLVSAIIKRILPVLAINFSVAASLVLLQDYSEGMERIWNPISLVSSRTIYMRAEFVNMAGYPVAIYYLCMVAAFIFIGGVAVISYFCWRKK